MIAAKETLYRALGDEPVSYTYRDREFRYTFQRANRSVDVAGLLRRGVPQEAFSTMKPSITQFKKWAGKHGWSDDLVDHYLLFDDGQEDVRSPRISIQ